MNNYLQLLFREIKGILLDKRFLSPVFHTNIQSAVRYVLQQNWSYTILSSFKIKMWYLKLRKVSCPKGVVKLINLTFPCWKNRRSVMLLKISNLMVREMNLCIILSKEFKNSLLTIFIRKLTTHPMR